MTGTPPPGPPQGSPPPQAGYPAPPAGYTPYATPAPREGRSVAFYVALFLSLLLFVSGGLNLLLLMVTLFGSAAGGFGGGFADDGAGMYQMVVAGGDIDAEDAVLRVPIEGAIAENSSALIGAVGGTVTQVRRALRAAESDESIVAILLDINSPGGGVTDSDEIHRLIEKFKQANPDTKVLALMGDIAASGGYYIAAPCHAIMARPTTITGSIGVIISNYQFGEALKKIGVESRAIVSDDTPYKDMLSPTRPMRPDEERKIKAIVQEMYERFVDIVDQGRPALSRDEVKQLATGEIYSATRAEQIGLVDAVGNIDAAYAKLREMTGSARFRVVEQRRIPTLVDALLGARAPRASMDEAVAQLLRSSTGPRLMYYWQGGR